MLSSRSFHLFRQIGSHFWVRRSFVIDETMPRSKEYVSSSDDSDDSSDKKSSKRKHKEEKKEEKAESSKKPKSLSKAEEEEPSWPLGKNRFVKIREFKGKMYVDIREMYMDKSGDLKPGKKGISMDMIQWRKFMDCVQEVDEVAKAKC